METIPKSECKKIGFIRKTHGVHGELVLEYEPQFEASIERADRFFLEIDGLLAPFFMTDNGFRYKSAETALITFDHLQSERVARRLVSCPVFLFRSEIEDEKENTSSSGFRDFQLLDELGRPVGLITDVDDYAGNVVLTIDGSNGPLLVPYNSELLQSVDRKNKTLSLRIPEGLFD